MEGCSSDTPPATRTPPVAEERARKIKDPVARGDDLPRPWQTGEEPLSDAADHQPSDRVVLAGADDEQLGVRPLRDVLKPARPRSCRGCARQCWQRRFGQARLFTAPPAAGVERLLKCHV